MGVETSEWTSSLATRSLGGLGAGSASTDPSFEPGACVGRYLVMREVGRGGMGVVLQAYDPKLQREVALKLVRGAAVSAEAYERMLREAQAMAKLSHPNVVAVFDLERVGAEVVLAMEFVRGETLATWLDGERGVRSWQAMLEAFVAAGDGIVAAHAAGVLHRDFKPANVLVGDDGRVRVTDFGIARWTATVTEGSERGTQESPLHATSTELTQVGDVVGTPRYMAPEQHAGARVGPAVDQYAFCVALFESLTGTRAFEGSGDALEAAKRRGPPAWPSVRRAAGTIPSRIVAAIERGLQPDPSERWPSMQALLEALSYDPKRWVGWWVAGASTVAVLAASSVAWAGWRHERAQRCTGATEQIEEVWSAQHRAQVEAAMRNTGVSYAGDTARAIAVALDRYADAWAAGHRDACEATTIRREQPAEVLDLRMACLHRAKVQLSTVVELFATADEQTVEKAHDVVAGLPLLSRCSDPEALKSVVPPPAQTDAADVEAVRVRLGKVRVLHHAGKYAEAQRVLDEAVRAADGIDYRPLRTEISLLRGIVSIELGRTDEARAAYRDALINGLRTGQLREARDAVTRLVYTVGGHQERLAEARAYVPAAVGLSQDGALEEAALRQSVAILHWQEGVFEKAEREYRVAVRLLEQAGVPERRLLLAKANLGAILRTAGRAAEAHAVQRAVLEAEERLLGREHPSMIGNRINLGNTLDMLGRYDEAEAQFREALVVAEKTLGPEHPDVALALNGLAIALTSQRRFAEARDVLRRAIAIREKLPEQPELANVYHSLGLSYLEERSYAETEVALRTALDLRLERLDPGHYRVAVVRQGLAHALHGLGRHEEALEQHRLELSSATEVWGPRSRQVARVRSDIGRALAAMQRHGKARLELRAAYAILQAIPDAPEQEVAEVRRRLDALEATRPCTRCRGAQP